VVEHCQLSEALKETIDFAILSHVALSRVRANRF